MSSGNSQENQARDSSTQNITGTGDIDARTDHSVSLTTNTPVAVHVANDLGRRSPSPLAVGAAIVALAVAALVGAQLLPTAEDHGESADAAGAAPSSLEVKSRSPKGTRSSASPSGTPDAGRTSGERDRAAGPAATVGASPSTQRRATPTRVYATENVACGEYRGTGVPGVQASACVQAIDGKKQAEYGIKVRNELSTQIVITARVQWYAHAKLRNCQPGEGTYKNVVIDPHKIWYSPLGECTAEIYGAGVQSMSKMAVDPEGTHTPEELNGMQFNSPTVQIREDGKVTFP